MSRPRIFYALRDDEAAAEHVCLLYRHVELLAASGFDACVLRRGPPSAVFAHVPAPVVDAASRVRLTADDRVAMPELWPDMIHVTRGLGLRRILICHSRHLLLQTLGRMTLRELGPACMMATSPGIASFVRQDLGFDDVAVVPPLVDADLYRPAVKRRQIAYRTRRRAMEAVFVKGLFRRLYPDLADVPWIELDDTTSASAPAVLGQSQFVLGIGLAESTYLPALAAMAAGALVAGYAGDGRRDVESPENGEWSPDGDSAKAVEALGRLIRRAESDSAFAERRRAAGFATAARYGRSALDAALTAFWSAELSVRCGTG